MIKKILLFVIKIYQKILLFKFLSTKINYIHFQYLSTHYPHTFNLSTNSVGNYVYNFVDNIFPQI